MSKKSEEKKAITPPAESTKAGVNPEKLDVPEKLPVLPLQGFVFFPGMGFPLQVTHEASKQLIDEAIVKDRLILLLAQKPKQDQEEDESDSSEEAKKDAKNEKKKGASKGAEPIDPKASELKSEEKISNVENLFTVGSLGYIHKLIKTPEGNYQILVSAIKKVKVLEFVQETPFPVAMTSEIPMDFDEHDKETEAMILNLRTLFKRMSEISQLPQELQMTVMSLNSPFHVAYLIGSQLNLNLQDEQGLLEVEPVNDLLRKVTLELNKKLETLAVSQEIQKSIKEDMDTKQREYFLRQQLRAIRKELGEDDENVELEDLRLRVEEAKLTEEARHTVEKELNRLRRIPSSSPEYTVARTYIDWILDLPWDISTEDNLDLENAQKTLDADHYGLDMIKKRIIEFLAVRKLKNDIHGPILCFVGPPGVGKTSLGQSIARTMNKNFVRISLGGVRDEAEIRGHRRTYIGSLPGRIIQSLKKAGSNNPLFMLDEIDKLGMDFRGDPSSALLEVLDPEQNFSFADHYLEIAFDLSKVMFITTANYIDNIPGPLRDRMEVIELSSYTEDEKLMIAKRHLVAKQVAAHALTKKHISINDTALRTVIRSYTREAGVRNLERKIGTICRGVAKEIALGHKGLIKVTGKDVEKYLGPVSFFPESKTRTWGPGLATGLAWTPVGGVLLFIEAAKMKGRGGLTLTGKLGEVMRESATAALTYIRSNAKKMKVDESIFPEYDLHVHVPEGATPKDGPSAGVALVVALTSMLTGIKARRDIAMTGEITLRGDVLPVGGIKEKVLAAVRSHIMEIILPALNEKDTADIPDEAKEGVTFHYVHGIADVLKIAFEEPPIKKPTKKAPSQARKKTQKKTKKK